MDRLDRIRRDLELLRHRLAAGEIDESTYDRLKAKLLHDVSSEDLARLRLTPTPASLRRVGPRGGTRTRPPRLADLEIEVGTLLLQQFRIVRELGRGGFGAVFEAEDVHLGKRLAVKLLDPRMAAREELLERFRREVGVMRELAHPRIVRVYDYREDADRHLALISMELIHGGSVRDLLKTVRKRNSRVPAALALTILGQMLEALAAAHQRGVVHRDVTPGNVLLSGGSPGELLDHMERDPAVKLVDFGIAGLVERVEISSGNRAMGTTGYAAPELSDPDAPVTAAVDCYGAGAVCYHLLTGSKAVGHFEAPSELREGLSTEVDHLVLALLERSPGRRPAPAEAAVEALQLAARARAADRNWLEARELTLQLDATQGTLAHAMESGDEAAVRRDIAEGREHLRLAEAFLQGTQFPPPSAMVRAQRALEELTSQAMAWTSANEVAWAHVVRSRELTAALERATREENLQQLRETVAAAQEHLLAHLPSLPAGHAPSPPRLEAALSARDALQTAVEAALPRIAAMEERAARSRQQAEDLTRLVERIANARSMLVRAEELGDARAAGDWSAYAQELLSQGRDLGALLPPGTAGRLEEATVELARQLGQTRSWLATLEARREQRAGPPDTGEPATPTPSGATPPPTPRVHPAPPPGRRTGWWLALVVLLLALGVLWAWRNGRRQAVRPGAAPRVAMTTSSTPVPTATAVPARPTPRTVAAVTPAPATAVPTEPTQATLVVESGGHGDTVWVDGEAAASTPARLRLHPGHHQIRVTRRGCQGATRWIDLAGGRSHAIHLQPDCPKPSARPTIMRQPTRTPTLLLPAATTGGVRGEPGELSIQTSLKIPFRRIPPGAFFMGSPENEPGRYADEQRHRVVITRGFWMMETEITQAQWEAVMGGDPAHFLHCGDHCPAENISWYDAVRFANALSKRSGLVGCYEIKSSKVKLKDLKCRGYRLPTEAEWEYAARSGTRTLYAGGDRLEALGWFQGNSGATTHPVGILRPNRWGLHDMSGNVWEWCWDGYRKRYPGGAVRDPLGAPGAPERVLRGGAWRFAARDCRVATRFRLVPGYKSYITGFRLVRTIP